VSDLKQFVYCPRVVYFSYVLPVEKASTYKMQVGQEEHVSLEGLESKRTLRRYGLERGERRFRVHLSSERYGLTGVLDLLIVSSADYYPVEFKNAPGGPALHHRYQLAAYCLLVEECFRAAVRTGFLYIVPRKQVVPVPMTPGIRERVRILLGRIRTMVAAEAMPPGTRDRRRCRDCEYRNYCADWM
jgi:CRISPR-associated exonuclease Cas4